MDPETSTMSSCSICPADYTPNFPSFNEKARPLPPPRAPSCAHCPVHKAPFILTSPRGSQPCLLHCRCPLHGPSQKATAYSPAPQKGPISEAPSCCQPFPERPQLCLAHLRNPVMHQPSPKKAPVMLRHLRGPQEHLVFPPKAVSHPAPNRKSVFLPAPSQKGLTSPTQHRMTLGPDSVSMVPSRSHEEGDMLEKRKPEEARAGEVNGHQGEERGRHGDSENNCVEVPFTTTEKKSEEVLIRRGPRRSP